MSRLVFTEELQQAWRVGLLHPSAPEATTASSKLFQRREFVGDALVNLLSAEYLVDRFEHSDEGELTATRQQMVERNGLGVWFVAAGLDRYTRTGAAPTGKMAADIMEVALALAYDIKGVDFVRQMAYEWWDSIPIKLVQATVHPKTALKQLAEKIGENYGLDVVDQEGPAHAPSFRVVASVGGQSEEGVGPSVKEAQKNAARKLLRRMDDIDG